MADKNLIEWNETKQEEAQELDDSELPSDPPGYVPQREPETPELDMEAVGGYSPKEQKEDEEYNEYLEEQDDTAILTDARERLERGRLYEMLMTSDIFANLDADPKAIKNVQRELRRFAKDRMEVMLGIKKVAEVNVVNVGVSQFNTLEVEVLKSLANKLSGGAAAEYGGPKQPPKSATLTPISNNSTKTKPAPITKPVPLSRSAPARTAPRAAPVQPQKEVVQIDPVLASKKIEDMTYDEKIEYNRQKSALYEGRKVASPEAIPMPNLENANVYGAKGGAIKTGYAKLDQIAANLVRR